MLEGLRISCRVLHTVPHIAGYNLKGEFYTHLWRKALVSWLSAFMLFQFLIYIALLNKLQMCSKLCCGVVLYASVTSCCDGYRSAWRERGKADSKSNMAGVQHEFVLVAKLGVTQTRIHPEFESKNPVHRRPLPVISQHATL